MGGDKRENSGEASRVSSFITAFICAFGAIESVCIKYAMYDGTSRLSYWEAKPFWDLYRCVEHYSGLHYYGSDLQRVSDEPAFATSLPERHPVHTMASEKPTLSEHEYQAAKERFRVGSILAVVDQGDSCRVETALANGCRRTEVLPGYIAMNLSGYLKAILELSRLMEAGGSH